MIDCRQRTSLPPDSGILQRWRGVVDIKHGKIVTGSMKSAYHMATQKSSSSRDHDGHEAWRLTRSRSNSAN